MVRFGQSKPDVKAPKPKPKLPKAVPVEEKPFLVQSKIPHYRADVVRPSMWIELADDGLVDDFTALWDEHVEGFKKRKRGKTAKDMNMLWRVQLKTKRDKAQLDAVEGTGAKPTTTATTTTTTSRRKQRKKQQQQQRSEPAQTETTALQARLQMQQRYQHMKQKERASAAPQRSKTTSKPTQTETPAPDTPRASILAQLSSWKRR